jgi:hypothetical protein
VKFQMSSSEKETRENGCIKTDCIVKLPCPRNPVIKTEDGFCIYMVTKDRRNAVEQKRVGGNNSK